MPQLFIGLGSNRGNRSQQLSIARGYCRLFFGPLVSISPVYVTAAWGEEDQADYLNQVISLRTEMAPEICLNSALAIENLMGRVRQKRWGPRVIDIDLLYIDELIVDTPTLQLPHPRIAQRSFVLKPLCDIAPEMIDPLSGKTIRKLYEGCKDPLEVRLYNPRVD
jgi:2-amino-4-hydroxy-6-hydroxymethyldihydropteridine diphosphokinase